MEHVSLRVLQQSPLSPVFQRGRGRGRMRQQTVGSVQPGLLIKTCRRPIDLSLRLRDATCTENEGVVRGVTPSFLTAENLGEPRNSILVRLTLHAA
jgi:hypothetical protein